MIAYEATRKINNLSLFSQSRKRQVWRFLFYNESILIDLKLTSPMLVILWIISFAFITLFSWWIVLRGGANKIEGTIFEFLFGWFMHRLNAEQIRFYVICMWIIALVIFILGLFYPGLRSHSMWLG